MADFVLVHGAWHGAWCWKRVTAALQARGHRGLAVSLTGVGERAHQIAPSIRLATHVDDVSAVIEAEELQGAVLVGHSYAGLVATGVADRHAARLAALVYLDAVLPRPGDAWADLVPEAARTERRAVIAAQGVIPPPDPAAFGLKGDDAAWVARRQTPQPGSLFDDPLRFDAARIEPLRRTYISCTAPALGSIEPSRQRARAWAGCRYVELAAGHDPMVSAPELLVDRLLEVLG